MTQSNGLQSAIEAKNRGNSAFSAKQFEKAVEEYTAVIDALSRYSASAKENPDAPPLRAIGYCNRAAAYLKLQKFEMAVEDCSEAIQLHPPYEKALFRRGEAYRGLKKWQAALVDMREVLRLNPKNKDAVNVARSLAEALRKEEDTKRSPVGRITAEVEELLSKASEDRTAPMKRLWELCRTEEGAKVIGAEPVLKRVSSALWESVEKGSVESTAFLCRVIARCASNESQPLSHETLESLAKVAQQVELWAMEEESDDSNTLLWLSRSIYARWLARKGETGAAIRHSFVREGVFALLTMASDAFSNKSPKSNQDAESEHSYLIIQREKENALLYASEGLIAACDIKDVCEELIKTSLFEAVISVAALGEDNVSRSVWSRAGRLLSVAILDRRRRDSRGESAGESKGETGAALLRRRLLQPLLAGLRRDTNSELGVKETACALSLLLQVDRELGNAAVQEGGLHLFLDLAKTAEDNEILRAATEAISHLATSKDKQATIIDLEGVKTLKRVFKKGDAVTKLTACMAVCKLLPQDPALLEAFQIYDRLRSATLQHAEEMRRQKASQSKGNEQEAQVELEKLPFMRMLCEALAFLSVHQPARILFAKDQEMLTGIGEMAEAAGKEGSDPVIQYGAISCLSNCLRCDERQLSENEEQLHRLQLTAQGEGVDVDAEMDALRGRIDDAIKAANERRLIFTKNGGAKSLVKLASSKSAGVRYRVSEALFSISEVVEARGMLVRDGALRALIALSFEPEPEGEDAKREEQFQRQFEQYNLPSSSSPLEREEIPKGVAGIRYLASHAIAKIGVTTVPSLYPQSTAVEMVVPLVRLCRGQGFALARYEAALTLANITSGSDEVREKAVREGGWRAMEYMASSENEKLVEAAAGVLCNLSLSDTIISKMVEDENDEQQRLKLFRVLAMHDSDEVARACVSALANLTGVDILAARMAKDGTIQRLREVMESSEEDFIIHPTVAALQGVSAASAEAAQAVSDEATVPLMMVSSNTERLTKAAPLATELLGALPLPNKIPDELLERYGEQLSQLGSSDSTS